MSLPKVRFCCEGKLDRRLIREILRLNYNIEISDKELEENNIIHNLGGYPGLKKVNKKITDEWSDYTSLIFLDADDVRTTEKSGRNKTIAYVENIMKGWNWEKFDLFVFPNNQSETGTIEDLVEEIVLKNDKNDAFFECWSNFERCLKINFSTLSKKSKLYTLRECFYGRPQNDFQFGDENLWDLNSVGLKPLMQFLDNHLK